MTRQGSRRRLRRLAGGLASLGIVALWFVAFSPTGIGGPVGVVWVSGTSMEPGLRTGDLVVTYEHDEYALGDIVAFAIPEGGVVIHRIIEITDDGHYRFQGDNRSYEDRWVLPADDIIGSRVFEVHDAATIAAWLSQPLPLAVMVAIITLLSLTGSVADETSETVIDLRDVDLRKEPTEPGKIRECLSAIPRRSRH